MYSAWSGAFRYLVVGCYFFASASVAFAEGSEPGAEPETEHSATSKNPDATSSQEVTAEAAERKGATGDGTGKTDEVQGEESKADESKAKEGNADESKAASKEETIKEAGPSGEIGTADKETMSSVPFNDEPPPNMVEPLEPWVPLPKSKQTPIAPAPKALPKATKPEVKRGYLFGDLEEDEEEIVVGPSAVKGEKLFVEVGVKSLKSIERKRIAKAKKRFLKEAYLLRKKVRNSLRRDPRGEVELRVCSVNTENLGLKVEVSRVLRGKLAKGTKRRETEIVSQLAQAGCEVVAVQAVLGHDVVAAKAGLMRLAELLQVQTSFAWDAFLGDTNHKFVRSGFLVAKKPGIEVVSTKNYTDTLLPRFETFQLEKFLRAPFEIALRVKRKGVSQEIVYDKEVIIMNIDFQDALRPAKEEPEAAKMQMAEAVRQLAVYRQHDFDPDLMPIYLVVGNRASGRYSPTTEVLEGGIQLTDFKSDGKCRLDGKNPFQYTCAERVALGKALLALVATSTTLQEEAQKIVQRQMRQSVQIPTEQQQLLKVSQDQSRLTDIYVFQGDLPSVSRHPMVSSQFAVGEVPVKYLAKGNPLLWVDLNW